MIEAIFHLIGICPDAMMHMDLLDFSQIPIIDLIKLNKNGR